MERSSVCQGGRLSRPVLSSNQTAVASERFQDGYSFGIWPCNRVKVEGPMEGTGGSDGYLSRVATIYRRRF